MSIQNPSDVKQWGDPDTEAEFADWLRERVEYFAVLAHEPIASVENGRRRQNDQAVAFRIRLQTLLARFGYADLVPASGFERIGEMVQAASIAEKRILNGNDGDDGQRPRQAEVVAAQASVGDIYIGIHNQLNVDLKQFGNPEEKELPEEDESLGEDKLLPQFRNGESPEGELLTAGFLKKRFGMSSSYLTKHVSDLSGRRKHGRGYVYPWKEVLVLSERKNAIEDMEK